MIFDNQPSYLLDEPMGTFRDGLLDLWEQLFSSADLEDALRTFPAALSRHLPVRLLIVRRFNQEQSAVQTVALVKRANEHITLTESTEASPAKFKRLLTWARSGELLQSSRSNRTGDLALLIPPEIEGDVAVIPLHSPPDTLGAVIVVAEHLKTFKTTHLDIIRELVDPFTAALEHDHRAKEIQLLREAAEAARQSYLNRLGQQESDEAIIGEKTGLRLVMERVVLVSHSAAPVLILGDTGTGKEVVARAIHTRSLRRNGPFIRVNCGAIPPELIDSQLFGHEKGSFTGASEQRKGWFERANGGTLFLDEIGELPLAAQVRLLRVLQEHQIERVGGEQPIHIDVRIVAATHRDLASMVKNGTFREDLWYRVNVFPIFIPRLRERIDDIPALATHFAQRAAARFGLPFVAPSASDIRILSNYAWPGNIRELQAVIDRACILGGGITLEVAKAMGTARPTPPAPLADDEPTFYEVVPESISAVIESDTRPIVTIDQAMKEHIQRALVETNGRVEGKNGAAKLLGINPHTLRGRMRKLKINWSTFRDE